MSSQIYPIWTKSRAPTTLIWNILYCKCFLAKLMNFILLNWTPCVIRDEYTEKPKALAIGAQWKLQPERIKKWPQIVLKVIKSDVCMCSVCAKQPSPCQSIKTTYWSTVWSHFFKCCYDKTLYTL